MLGSNLFNFTGVMYVLIIQLYCINLSLVLMVCVCTFEHIIPQSSTRMSSCKSPFHCCLLRCFLMSSEILLLHWLFFIVFITKAVQHHHCNFNDEINSLKLYWYYPYMLLQTFCVHSGFQNNLYQWRANLSWLWMKISDWPHQMTSVLSALWA